MAPTKDAHAFEYHQGKKMNHEEKRKKGLKC